MMPLLCALPGAEPWVARLQAHWPCESVPLQLHRFPDGECCPRYGAALAGRDVTLVAAPEGPDAGLFALYLCASVARELGARSVGLVLPYLPYMRQDAAFAPGQGVTSLHVARLLSGCADWLVTVDPHLHRHPTLAHAYTLAAEAVPSAPAIAHWLASSVARPYLVGPDSESAQWVSEVARLAGCPWTVLEKQRRGDRDVSVADAAARLGEIGDATPVLIDDMASSGRTMAAAVALLKEAGLAAPVCVVVHALFATDALATLLRAGPARVISCNTVAHASNGIDVAPQLALAAQRLCQAVQQTAGQAAR